MKCKVKWHLDDDGVNLCVKLKKQDIAKLHEAYVYYDRMQDELHNTGAVRKETDLAWKSAITDLEGGK